MTREECKKRVLKILEGYAHADLIPILADRIWADVVKTAEDEIRVAWEELLFRDSNADTVIN